MRKSFNQSDLKQLISSQFDEPVKNVSFETDIHKYPGTDKKAEAVLNGCVVEFDTNKTDLFLNDVSIGQIIQDSLKDVNADADVVFRMSTRNVKGDQIPVFKGCYVEYPENNLDVSEPLKETEQPDVQEGEVITEHKVKNMSGLADIHRKEQAESLMNLPDRDLCEMIRAHFDSHPTLPGEKSMKDQVNQVLAQYEEQTQAVLAAKQAPDVEQRIAEIMGSKPLSQSDKEDLVNRFAQTRIRETKLKEGNQYLDFRNTDPHELAHQPIDVPGLSDNVSVTKVNVLLERNDDNDVCAYAKREAGGYMRIGTLPDSFLTNNPMNVDNCEAELQVADYSNGKMKNLSTRIVVDTDVMSGDVIDLDENMLSGLEQDFGLEQ